MNRQMLVVVLSIFLVCAAGCKGPRKEKTYPSLTKNVVEKLLERSVGNCDSTDSACAQVSLHYLEFLDGLSLQVRDSLSAAIRARVFAPVNEGDMGGGSADSVASQFLSAFESTRSEMPEITSRWSLERWAKVAGDTLGIGTIEFDEGSYTGGAHPNSFQVYGVFDLITGRRLTLENIVAPGTFDSVNALAEVEFRELQQLGRTDNLDSAGFWFPGNRFRVNTNFYLSSDGLAFYFNPYEVAPYAVGPIELTIPYAKLRTILTLRKQD